MASSLEHLARELECGVCLESLRDPKILDCAHTFCRHCLNGLADSKSKTIKCPMCTGRTAMPPGGLGALKSNLLARSMVETLANMNPPSVEVAQEATEPSEHCPPTKHSIYKAGDISNRPISEIKALCERLKSEQTSYEQTMWVIREREVDFFAAAVRAKTDVNAAAESIIADVREKQIALLRIIDSMSSMRKHSIESYMASIQRVLRDVKVALGEMDNLESDDDAAIRELHRRVKQALEQMEQNPLPSADVTDGMSFLKFVAEKTPAYNIHLGDLLEKEEWQLDLTFGKFGPEVGQFNCARGVAISPSGDMAIGEQRNNRTCIFSTKGKHVLTMTGKSAGNADRGDRDVAFFPDGRCLILGKNNNINVYDRRGSYLNSILIPTKNPWCLAVANGNTIYVGDFEKKLIYVMVDGLVTRQIQLAHGPLSLAVYKGKILVSSAGSKCVDVLDIPTGDTLFSITSKSVDPADLVSPWGPCFGPDGSIFVPFYKSDVFYKGTVHEFGPDGRHMGCVARSLQTPRNVDFTRDGRLVVVDGTSIKLYRKM